MMPFSGELCDLPLLDNCRHDCLGTIYFGKKQIHPVYSVGAAAERVVDE